MSPSRRLDFLACRWIWSHHMHVACAFGALFFIGGLLGPRYGGALAGIALVLARSGVVLGLLLWFGLQSIRRKSPAFTMQAAASDAAGWLEVSPLARAGRTALFVGVAVLLACLGALIGTLAVYLAWRLT